MRNEVKRANAPKAKSPSVKSVAVKAKARADSSSGILAAIHETVSDLHKAKVVKTETMREFDKLCLEPVVKFGAKQIAALRAREKVSQPVFAMYLNVSKSSVCQWESGEKNPDGAALKLLNVVNKKGLEVLA
jgi:putative transcriptional regulator